MEGHSWRILEKKVRNPLPILEKTLYNNDKNIYERFMGIEDGRDSRAEAANERKEFFPEIDRALVALSEAEAEREEMAMRANRFSGSEKIEQKWRELLGTIEGAVLDHTPVIGELRVWTMRAIQRLTSIGVSNAPYQRIDWSTIVEASRDLQAAYAESPQELEVVMKECTRLQEESDRRALEVAAAIAALSPEDAKKLNDIQKRMR